MNEEMTVEPITRKDKDGHLYRRRDEVEVQIRYVLTLSVETLLERLKIDDFQHDSYVKSESLAFLIRHFGIRGNESLVERLVLVVTRRIRGQIDKGAQLVPINLRLECFDAIASDVVTRLVAKDNRADYAQVSFGHWVKSRILDAVKNHVRIGKIDVASKNVDSDTELETQLQPENKCFRVGEILPQERPALIREALNQLNDKERNVFFLRYVTGLEIENKNVEVETISKRLGVTPKTVYNRLKSAEAKLAKWRSDRGQ